MKLIDNNTLSKKKARRKTGELFEFLCEVGRVSC